MRIKKIISISLAAIMSFLILTTTVMAATANKYNKAYEFTGKGNEMSWLVKGTSEKARTKATNTTSYSRYVCVYTKKCNYKTDAIIASKSDDNIGKQVYANAAIARDKTNVNQYFVHQALLRPSATIEFNIDTLYYRINQRK